MNVKKLWYAASRALLPAIGAAVLVGCSNLSTVPGASMKVATPTLSVIQGETTPPETLTITPQNGLAGTIALNYAVQNQQGQAVSSGFSFTPTSVTLNGVTTVQPSLTVASSVPTGTYTVQVNASEGDVHFGGSFDVVVTPAKATINSFTPSTSSLSDAGGTVTLAWNVSNAVSYALSVSPSKSVTGIPSTIPTSQNQVQVQLPANPTDTSVTYTFTLSATGPGGPSSVVTQTATVTESQVPAPAISQLTITPTSLNSNGGQVGLQWQASNAQSYQVTVSGSSNADLSGVAGTSLDILSAQTSLSGITIPANTTTPAATQTYTFTLTALGEAGNPSATKSVSIDVTGQAQGHLQLVLAGIPSGTGFTPPSVTLVGGGYSKTLRSNQTFDATLSAETYTLSAPSFEDAYGNIYSATLSGVSNQTVSGSGASAVASGQVVIQDGAAPTQVSVTYSTDTAQVQFAVSGLPSGKPSALILTPASGSPVTITGSGTENLPAGTYTVTDQTKDSSYNYSPQLSATPSQALSSATPGPSTTLTLTAGDTYSLSAAYAATDGAALISVQGIPAVANPPSVSFGPLTGAPIFTTTQNVSSQPEPYLPQASYAVSAPAFYDRFGDQYTASLKPPSPISITNGATTDITVSYATTTGQLVIGDSGLPGGAPTPQVTVSNQGVNDPSINAPGTYNLAGGPSGSPITYLVSGAPVVYQGVTYTAAQESPSVTDGQTQSVTLAYQVSDGTVTVSVSGLPSSLTSLSSQAAPVISVGSLSQTDSSYTQGGTQTLTFSPLAVGASYSFTATDPVSYTGPAGQQNYHPTLPSPVSLTAANPNASAAVTYQVGPVHFTKLQGNSVTGSSPNQTVSVQAASSGESVTLSWVADNAASYSLSANPSTGVTYGTSDSSSFSGSTATSEQVNFPYPGSNGTASYTLTLTAQGSGGGSASATFTVTVGQLGYLQVQTGNTSLPTASGPAPTLTLKFGSATVNSNIGVVTGTDISSEALSVGSYTLTGTNFTDSYGNIWAPTFTASGTSSQSSPASYTLTTADTNSSPLSVTVTYSTQTGAVPFTFTGKNSSGGALSGQSVTISGGGLSSPETVTPNTAEPVLLPASTTSYTLTANPVKGNTYTYQGSVTDTTLTVSAGGNYPQTVSYAPSSGAASVTISGTGTSNFPSITLAPKANPSQSNTTTFNNGNISNQLVPYLPATTYLLTAPNFTDQYGNVYSAALSSNPAGTQNSDTLTTSITNGATTDITVSYATTTGQLVIGASYPSQVPAATLAPMQVSPSGTNTVLKQVSSNGSYNLPAGSYTVSAGVLDYNGSSYTATPSSATVVVTAGGTVSQNFTYQAATGSLTVDASGLPGDSSASPAAITVNGQTQDISSAATSGSTVFDYLPPQTYSVGAADVTDPGPSASPYAETVTYAPTPSAQSASVTAGQNATASVTYAPEPVTLTQITSSDNGQAQSTGTSGETVTFSWTATNAEYYSLSVSPSTGVQLPANSADLTTNSAQVTFPNNSSSADESYTVTVTAHGVNTTASLGYQETVLPDQIAVATYATGAQPVTGLAINSSGAVFTVNPAANQVEETTTAGTNSFASSDVVAPYAVAVDGSGNVWVANGGGNCSATSPDNCAVLEYLSSGGTPTVFTGTADSSTSATFNEARSIAIDNSGNVWVGSYANSEVVEIAPSTSSYTPYFLPARPNAIATDGSGNVWVTTQSGLYELVSGASSFTQVAATSGQDLQGVAVDRSGNVWFADPAVNTVYEYVPGTATLNAFTNAHASQAAFSNPYGVAVDGSGNVWVTNEGSTSVAAILAGSSPSSYSPVVYSSTSLQDPAAIGIGTSGRLWLGNTNALTPTNLVSISGLANPTTDPLVAQTR